jgi:site-specific recombinase XerD
MQRIACDTRTIMGHEHRPGSGRVDPRRSRAVTLESAADLPATETADAFDRLLADAATFATHARAKNTLAGYNRDMADFGQWCQGMRLQPLPADPRTVAVYITALAKMDAAVGTISRRLSSIRHFHLAADYPDPTTDPGVRYVMAGIRRDLGRKPDRATALVPPLLFDVLAACPTAFTTQKGRDETHLAGLRDRALLMVGFVGALRRSEIAAARIEDLQEHTNGLLLEIPRSKTNQDGTTPELVVLPRARVADHCPVILLRTWREAAGITSGPVFRAITKGNRIRTGDAPLSHDRINQIVRDALRRAGVNPDAAGYSAHSLRAGFATYAASRGLSDRAIQRQTRHKDVSTVLIYTRHESAWTDNAATELGL